MVDPKKVHSIIGKHMLADGMEPVIDLDKSHGSWLVDGRDGREYLDLFSMFASISCISISLSFKRSCKYDLRLIDSFLLHS